MPVKSEDAEKRMASELMEAAGKGSFARKMGIRCLDVGPGYAKAEMTISEEMLNLFGMAHGGAIFTLMDDVFQLACNSRGVAAFALNVSSTFIRGGEVGDRLTAEATEVALTTRTGTYELRVTDEMGRLVAVAQAIAYRKKDRPPFLSA